MSTEIVFILDRSGSMGGLENDVIGGFNSFLSEQQKLEDKAKLTTVLFDHEYEVLHNRVKIQKVEPITNKQYWTRGSTALLDAIGKTILNFRDNPRKKKNKKVLFIINTDGEENSSKEFSLDKIREMISEVEENFGWKFIFLGANIDAFEEGYKMGISFTGQYTASPDGIRSSYSTISNVTTQYRSTSSFDEDLLDNME